VPRGSDALSDEAESIFSADERGFCEYSIFRLTTLVYYCINCANRGANRGKFSVFARAYVGSGHR
jgi:hypothetical protein